MQEQESVLENGTHKIHWDFEIQTDDLIATRKLDLVIINNKKKMKEKRICQKVGYVVPADQRNKIKENEKKDNFLDLARDLKMLWNMKWW